jgi:hypothetical protein
MKFLGLLFGFTANLIYLSYMTFIERKDYDFEFLPFGQENLGEASVTESLVYFP